MQRRTVSLVALMALGLGACVFGFRGAVAVTASYPLTGVDAVHIDLGATPLTILGDEMAPGLELEGVWRSVGGSAAVAKEQAGGPAIAWTIDQGFGELRAIVPLKLVGQVDLEVDEIRLPPDRDLDLVTDLGDVYVFAVAGNLAVDVGVGHVDIDGGAGGVAVRTGEGDLDVRSTGNMDLHTGRGHARVQQDGAGGNDIVVRARGDIEVVLRSDANLDLQLSGREIRVHTGAVSTVTRRSFTRQVGGGSVKIHATALDGDVLVRLTDGP